MFKQAVLIVGLCATSAVLSQDARTDGVVVTDVKLGSHVASDFSVPVPKTLFRPVDRIHAVISTLAKSPASATLGVSWTYGEGDELQSVYDDSREISFQGVAYYDFEISNPEPWPEGVYHVEVFLNGAAVAKRDFTVR